MRKGSSLLCFAIVFLLLVGCGGVTNQQSAKIELPEEDTTETVEHSLTNNEEETKAGDTTEEPVNNKIDVKKEEEQQKALSEYSSEQIEYARVWLQLGPNQEIDELYVQHIPMGEPLNPIDETSASYPENVIQLSGARLIDGSVTYSGNGDGTINVYNVPFRWDGIYPAGEEFYTEIINNTQLVYIDPGNDEEVIELIKLLHTQN